MEFGLYGRGQWERWRCKRCVGEAVTRRHQKVRRTLIAEAGGCCLVCGNDRCLINLHFHHVDPGLKSFALTTARGKSLAACREEARKCVLVCANCHGEIEAGLIESPPAGTLSGTPRPPTRLIPVGFREPSPEVRSAASTQLALTVD
jgi:hypothetical protein